MTRENRSNVLFLCVFLGISLPGAVILFKKKLDPAAPAMYLPDPVKRRLPYMFPHPVAAEVTRYVPKLAGQWVSQVNAERGGDPAVLSTSARLPLTSRDGRYQVTDLRTAKSADGATHTLLHVVVWDDTLLAEPARFAATIQADDQTLRAAKADAASVPLPAPVRKELIFSGYSKPPARTTWLTLHFPGDLSARRSVTLHLTYTAPSGATEQASIDVVSSPASNPTS